MEQTHTKRAQISLVAPKQTTINSGDMPPLIPLIPSSRQDTIACDLHNPSSYAEALIRRGKKQQNPISSSAKDTTVPKPDKDSWLPS